MLNLFSNEAFTFLPIFIGFSATKRFGSTPVLGAIYGVVYPLLVITGMHHSLIEAVSMATLLILPLVGCGSQGEGSKAAKNADGSGQVLLYKSKDLRGWREI